MENPFVLSSNKKAQLRALHTAPCVDKGGFKTTENTQIAGS